MTSNTKLTTEEKAELKEMKIAAANSNIRVINLDNKTVMAYSVKGNTVEFSLAVMSPDEKKFRVKVGEYYALSRFELGNTVKMDKIDFETMCENVWDAYLI